MITSHSFGRGAFAAIAVAAIHFSTAAPGPITIPNGSLESPVAGPPFGVTPLIDSWQENPMPSGYTPENVPGFGPIEWFQTTGAFANPPVGQSGHKDNIDGIQAGYVFAFTDAGIFQDLSAQYIPGESYTFTLGVYGGPGATGGNLQLSLYYRGLSNEIIPINFTNIPGGAANFPVADHFVDFSVTKAVQAGDAWAGKNIGIQIRSTVKAGGGGYYDIDNARLQAVPEPTAAFLLLAGGAWLTARRDRRRVA